MIKQTDVRERASVSPGEPLLSSPPVRPHFLSQDDCQDILTRLTRVAKGGGYTSAAIISVWTGNIRWGRNQVISSGEISNNRIRVRRSINGAASDVEVNDTTDAALVAAARRAERLMTLVRETPNDDLLTRRPLEEGTHPSLFSETTYQLDADSRAAAATTLIQQAVDAGMFSAGYIEVAAVGMGLLDTLGRMRYIPYTQVRYSVTVRDPKGTGSGWAGDSWYDWAKIDPKALTARALDKCLKSRNPVAIEPGRYTTILEPQAVADFVGELVNPQGFGENVAAIQREMNERVQDPGPFLKLPPDFEHGIPGYSKLGEKVVDERVTISADPMDQGGFFPPFSVGYGYGARDAFDIPVYHPATWIEHGVLKSLAYDREYAIKGLGQDTGLPNSGAFRMSGGDTSIDEMIATTKRGILVTRFDQVVRLSEESYQLYRGYTRDGLWLIENGKISKPVKNMVFTESILFALNNIDQLGPPQRVFRPNVLLINNIPQPVIVPSLKINDFSFTALADSI